MVCDANRNDILDVYFQLSQIIASHVYGLDDLLHDQGRVLFDPSFLGGYVGDRKLVVSKYFSSLGSKDLQKGLNSLKAIKLSND